MDFSISSTWRDRAFYTLIIGLLKTLLMKCLRAVGRLIRNIRLDFRTESGSIFHFSIVER